MGQHFFFSFSIIAFIYSIIPGMTETTNENNIVTKLCLILLNNNKYKEM